MATICQSCGMPMTQDPEGGGTNADGSLSQEWCSFCYKNGAFTGPDLTAPEMQQIGINALKAKGFPKPLGWLMTRNIPKLKRWV